MISQDLRYVLPALPPAADERIITYHLAGEFHREVDRRHENRRYCQWYRDTARQHQREIEEMRGDINLLGWFGS